MAEYISIKEFADRAGITPQAVYPRLTGRLAKYAAKDENGDWRISTDALEGYAPQERDSTPLQKAEQPLVEDFTNTLQEVAKDLKSTYQDIAKDLQVSYQELEKNLKSTFQELEKGLQAQIKDLQRQVSERDATIAAKDAKIAELAGRIADIAVDNQRIHAVQMAQLTAGESEKAEEPKARHWWNRRKDK